MMLESVMQRYGGPAGERPRVAAGRDFSLQNSHPLPRKSRFLIDL